MNETEWRGYYSQMILRGVKPAKEAEMVANCGGEKRTMLPDPADPQTRLRSPGGQEQVEQIEPFDEAVERIKGEIREMSSRANLERKTYEIIAEMRRR